MALPPTMALPPLPGFAFRVPDEVDVLNTDFSMEELMDFAKNGTETQLNYLWSVWQKFNDASIVTPVRDDLGLLFSEFALRCRMLPCGDSGDAPNSGWSNFEFLLYERIYFIRYGKVKVVCPDCRHVFLVPSGNGGDARCDTCDWEYPETGVICALRKRISSR